MPHATRKLRSSLAPQKVAILGVGRVGAYSGTSNASQPQQCAIMLGHRHSPPAACSGASLHGTMTLDRRARCVWPPIKGHHQAAVHPGCAAWLWQPLWMRVWFGWAWHHRGGRGMRPKYRSSPGVRTWSPTVLLIWPNGAYVPSADGMGGFHHGMNDPCILNVPKDSHSGHTSAFCFVWLFFSGEVSWLGLWPR